MTPGSIRVLYILIILVVAAFGLRVVDFVAGVSTLTHSAYAAEEKKEEAPKKETEASAAADAEAPKTEDHASDSKDAPANDDKKEPEKKDAKTDGKKDEEPAQQWKDAGDSDPDSAALRMEVFDELTKRRNDLDKRDKELALRQAMLEAAEKEIDRKYQELALLRKQIEGLLEQQSEEEKARTQSLVKIYENMKPKDAARIFNTLDLDVLISVMSKMQEKKLSAILAEMNEDRARTITIMLAEQKNLPSLPPASQ